MQSWATISKLGYFPHNISIQTAGEPFSLFPFFSSHSSSSFSPAGRPRFPGPAINAARDLQLVHDVVRLLQTERRQLEGKRERKGGNEGAACVDRKTERRTDQDQFSLVFFHSMCRLRRFDINIGEFSISKTQRHNPLALAVRNSSFVSFVKGLRWLCLKYCVPVLSSIPGHGHFAICQGYS